MFSAIKKKMKDQRGVTLIELLVVIVILGIIAAIAIPMVTANQNEAETAVDDRNIQLLQDAVNRYMVDNPDLGVPKKDDDTPDYTKLVPTYLSDEIDLQGTGTIEISDAGLVSIE